MKPESTPLQLSEAQMRQLGYRVIDMVIEHIQSLPDKSPTRKADRQTMESLFREVIPQEKQDPLEVLHRMERDVFTHIMHIDHPRFFAFIPNASNFISVMADTLASGFNVFAGTWLESASAAQIELVTIDWLCKSCGLPEGSGGLFTSGGSAANLNGIVIARHVLLNDDISQAVAYCSDQTHSSVERAFRILGFQPDQLRKLPSDKEYRLDVSSLREAIHHDREVGRRPFCVIATPGTTNTGAIDPLPQLAEICRAEQIWLHADGAFGAAAVFSARGRNLLNGIELVDSLSLDPHKWLFQPYEAGCLLVRQRQWLGDTFHILPEYLADTAGLEGEINFCDYGLQLTRGFRALKLWMSLQVFGAQAFSDAITHGFEMAELAESMIDHLECWQVVTPAQMGILTFRATPRGYTESQIDEHNQELVAAILQDGYAMIVSTKLRGQTVLRMCPINPRTTEDDIRKTIEHLDNLSKSLQKE